MGRKVLVRLTLAVEVEHGRRCARETLAGARGRMLAAR